MAIEAGNPAAVDVLLGHGADPEIMTRDGFPPLWFALKNSNDFGDHSVAKKLVARGASPAAVSDLFPLFMPLQFRRLSYKHVRSGNARVVAFPE